MKDVKKAWVEKLGREIIGQRDKLREKNRKRDEPLNVKQIKKNEQRQHRNTSNEDEQRRESVTEEEQCLIDNHDKGEEESLTLTALIIWAACNSLPILDRLWHHRPLLSGVSVTTETGSPPAVARRQSPWRCIWIREWDRMKRGKRDYQHGEVNMYSITQYFVSVHLFLLKPDLFNLHPSVL